MASNPRLRLRHPTRHDYVTHAVKLGGRQPTPRHGVTRGVTTDNTVALIQLWLSSAVWLWYITIGCLSY